MSIFTTKHYVQMAILMRKLPEGIKKMDLIQSLCEMFGEDSERFDLETFWDACQSDEGDKERGEGDVQGYNHGDSRDSQT